MSAALLRLHYSDRRLIVRALRRFHWQSREWERQCKDDLDDTATADEAKQYAADTKDIERLLAELGEVP